MTRIIVLDTETTGKEVSRDQIVEISLRFGLEEHAEVLGVRIKPDVPIHPEAAKVHGITAEDLANCLPFRDAIRVVLGAVESADVIVGFNVGFDLDILQAELERAGLPKLDLSTKIVVDALRLWHHVEPRTLTAAYEKFTGDVMTNAHAASADVEATARVLVAMLGRFGLAGKAWPELAAIADPFDKRRAWIGPTNHIQWDRGEAVMQFGKHRGVPLHEVERGFLSWVLRKDFPPHVHEICNQALQLDPPALKAWLVERFPRPAQQEAA